jgi:hypothetical protein
MWVGFRRDASRAKKPKNSNDEASNWVALTLALSRERERGKGDALSRKREKEGRATSRCLAAQAIISLLHPRITKISNGS